MLKYNPVAAPPCLSMVPRHEGGIGVDILLEHRLQRFLDQFALVVEGVADAVQIDLGLTHDRAGNPRQDVLQMFCGADPAERSRRVADDADRLAEERTLAI